MERKPIAAVALLPLHKQYREPEERERESEPERVEESQRERLAVASLSLVV